MEREGEEAATANRHDQLFKKPAKLKRDPLRKALKTLIDFTKNVVHDKAKHFSTKLEEKNRIAFLDLLLSYRFQDESCMSLENIQEGMDHSLMPLGQYFK